jgi:hypothetical protein
MTSHMTAHMTYYMIDHMITHMTEIGMMAVAAVMVQGLYLNIENSQNSGKKLLQNQAKIKKNINGLHYCYDDEGAVSRVRVHV